MKTCIINTLFVIESLTIVNLLNKVQFPFVKVFPPQMLSSSSEGAIVQAVPIAFAPVYQLHHVACWPYKTLVGTSGPRFWLFPAKWFFICSH